MKVTKSQEKLIRMGDSFTLSNGTTFFFLPFAFTKTDKESMYTVLSMSKVIDDVALVEFFLSNNNKNDNNGEDTNSVNGTTVPEGFRDNEAEER